MLGDESVAHNQDEAMQFDRWAGWLALVIFIPLVATSVDLRARKLGPWWRFMRVRPGVAVD